MIMSFLSHKYKRHRTLMIGALLIIALGIVGYGIYARYAHGADGRAAAIVATCAKDESHDECYETLVPQLYPKLSVAQLFDIVKEIRTVDPSYQFCHVLAHKIGEVVVAQDPEHWRDALAFNPSDGMCSNGYLHGVVGGRFRSEVLDPEMIQKLVPDFSLACEASQKWHPTSFDRAVCYHGMGHLYDFITNADLKQALVLCEKTTPENMRRMCIQGVFMQIYQPLEPDDYVLIEQMPVKPTKTTVRTFCATFKLPEYVGSCMEESWPLFRTEILSGKGAEAFCAGYPNAEEADFCWRGVSAIIGRMSLADPAQAQAACDAVPVQRKGMCYSGSAQAIVEETRLAGAAAVAFCGRTDGAAEDECYFSLANEAPSLFGTSAGLDAFCALLPADYRGTCLQARGGN